ncbi:proteasome subunit beta type-2 [Scaptodrosophila lebanonensis]|uniref:Proteasome subunit beta type-2 n=1 Tax=Drosophila lebanonensis TaxID=7225 RepID=A0A6J2UL08_DROLE|nr:proteasome subunit beta type-2 [Scaptodrosophila lebanonensis]
MYFADTQPISIGMNSNFQYQIYTTPTTITAPRVPARTMVGMICDQGIVVATNSCGNMIYYMDAKIFTCASSTGFDQQVMLDVGTKVYNSAHDKRKEVTVGQVLDLVCKHYERSNIVDVVLAGEDSEGLHLYSIHGQGTATRLPCVTSGAGAVVAAEHLESSWKINMSLEEAEQLARVAIMAAEEDANDLDQMPKVETCTILKKSEDNRNSSHFETDDY